MSSMLVIETRIIAITECSTRMRVTWSRHHGWFARYVLRAEGELQVSAIYEGRHDQWRTETGDEVAGSLGRQLGEIERKHIDLTPESFCACGALLWFESERKARKCYRCVHGYTRRPNRSNFRFQLIVITAVLVFCFLLVDWCCR